MKRTNRIIILVALMGLTASLFAQQPPIGTVQLEPSKTDVKYAEYIDKNEITVADWREFLFWIEQKQGKTSAEYISMLPDTATLQKSIPDWKHPAYSRHPIVGISYEQAIEYCQWRTARVNEYLEKNGITYKVSYNLPTETDFKEAYKQQKVKTFDTNLSPISNTNKNLINIGGNAQELTLEKTVFQGDNDGTLKFYPYKEPCANIGFRCVAKIIK